jgi:hypothetical protein
MFMEVIPTSNDIFWQTGLKRKIQKLLHTGDPSHQQKQALAEGEGLDEDLPSQWPLKTVRDNNANLRQSRLQTYIDQMR